jgi:thiamine transport system substrate-binding protein
VFYSKTKLTESPTGSLSVPGAVFRQVEGVALVKGGKAREAAEKFIEFMRSPEVQKQMQTEMWMFPVEAGVARADAMKFAPEPAQFDSPSDQDIADKGAAWVARWTKVVLK